MKDLYFITSRELSQPFKDRVTHPRVISFAKRASSNNSVCFCQRDASGTLFEIGNEAFFKHMADSSYDQILLHIHGYNVDPEEALEQGQRLQAAFDLRYERHTARNYAQRTNVCVVPIIWPSAGTFGAYRRDQHMADLSAVPLMAGLMKFAHWYTTHKSCGKTISILAHSMGNRVLQETLHHYGIEGGGRFLKFAFMLAADILNEGLEPGGRAHIITQFAKSVGVYYADDDMALKASGPANLFINNVYSMRLGLSGPEDMSNTPHNVWAVNADWANARGNGHSYYVPAKPDDKSLVFDHIAEALERGTPRLDERRYITLKP